MHDIIVDLFIPADEFIALYQGRAENVLARSRDGRRVAFPARILQPYVTHSGIKGSFLIQFDAQFRFQRIQRLDGPA